MALAGRRLSLGGLLSLTSTPGRLLIAKDPPAVPFIPSLERNGL